MPSFQIFTPAEISSLRTGGSILRACLDHTASLVQPGVTTLELDQAAEDFIRSHNGATPAFKDYQKYPATLCTSVNHQCVHGLPCDYRLQEGDIVGIDCGVIFDDLYTDACVTVGVGEVSSDARKVMDASSETLQEMVEMIQAGVKVGDISATAQKGVESRGCTVVSMLTGHGLGRTLHQYPEVPNVGKAGTGPVLPANTLIAIEPIVCLGKPDIVDSKDGWTIETKDGSLSAHFEHTVLIQEGGVEIIA